MPSLAAISKIDFPFKTGQENVKQYIKNLFSPSFPEIERMLPVFENSGIRTRNFCKPLDYYAGIHSFQEQNNEYIRLSLEYAVEAITQCLATTGIPKEDITDILFVSTTGLATPGIDALIINKMRLNPHINRMAVFGLGCGGGVSGYAKASTLAKANPDAVVLLVAVELCSLTFMKDDFCKSNFIGTTLFSDGVAACLITGDNYSVPQKQTIRFLGSRSKLFYDTLDIMGWDFTDHGFKVLFSPGIPAIIADNAGNDVTNFLAQYGIDIKEIKNFIFHPGGKKVLAAYVQALGIENESLEITRQVMNEYGNMSSTTVLYVLDTFYKEGFKNGYGLMMSMGPGFSCEMVLLEMNN